MAKYIIQVIGHALKNNVVASFGDEVDETQLTTNAADLVNQGFIKKVEGSDVVEDIEEEDPKEETDLDPEKEEEEEEDPKEEVKAPVAEVSKKDEVIGKFKK